MAQSSQRSPAIQGYVGKENITFYIIQLLIIITQHNHPAFLPWHRSFLLDFQDLVHTIDKTVTVPYYDFSIDSQAPANAVIWKYFGSSVKNGCVPDGPFAGANKCSYPNNHCLARGFDPSGAGMSTLTTTETLGQITRNSANYTVLEEAIEYGYHAVLHNTVGGTSGDMAQMYSPNDPVFFMHHMFVDKLWYDWSNAHPSLTYLPTSDRSTKMLPRGMAISALESSAALCYTYAQPGAGSSVSATTSKVAATSTTKPAVVATSVVATTATSVVATTNTAVTTITSQTPTSTLSTANASVELNSTVASTVEPTTTSSAATSTTTESSGLIAGISSIVGALTGVSNNTINNSTKTVSPTNSSSNSYMTYLLGLQKIAYSSGDAPAAKVIANVSAIIDGVKYNTTLLIPVLPAVLSDQFIKNMMYNPSKVRSTEQLMMDVAANVTALIHAGKFIGGPGASSTPGVPGTGSGNKAFGSVYSPYPPQSTSLLVKNATTATTSWNVTSSQSVLSQLSDSASSTSDVQASGGDQLTSIMPFVLCSIGFMMLL
jgi:hypothetical protein